MAYEDLASALAPILLAYQNQDSASNPWNQAQANVDKLDLYSPRRSNTSNILSGLVQGIASGGLKMAGDYTDQKAQQAKYDELAKMIALPSAERNAAMSGPGYEDITFAKPFIALDQLGQEAEKRKQENDLAKIRETSSASYHPPYSIYQGGKRITVDPKTGEVLGEAPRFAGDTPIGADLAKSIKEKTGVELDPKISRADAALLSQTENPNNFEVDYAKKLDAATPAIRNSLTVLDALEKFDPNESLPEALGRAVKAGVIKDSEAADLKRVMDLAIFQQIKPMFPGSVSDQEREAMKAALGGDVGVPVGTIKTIFERAINGISQDLNNTRQNALSGGFRMKFPSYENPLVNRSINSALSVIMKNPNKDQARQQFEELKTKSGKTDAQLRAMLNG